ncbi:cation diffusion facilitator family transporter [Salinisphaera sp. PC39]|uniref:cation diffusion facilitator family transporter n=1 Tax=Salinisphaera sp. PC39 TaxID=1304156 RepID=UPI0033415EE2
MAQTLSDKRVGTPAASDYRAYRRKRRATLAGAAINLPLAAIKIAAGYFGRSQALLADGLHSLADLVSDALVLAAIRVGAKNADYDHPYGHARIETAAMAFVSLLLILAGAGIAFDALRRLADPSLLLRPGWPALIVAAASLALKEGIYWYTIRAARRTRSPLLEANAWHHRSDALSSVAALAAIGGSMAGMPYLDAAGAIVIAVMLAGVGVRYTWQSLRELVDTGLEPDRLAVVRRHIASVPGVRRMRRLRTRTMGGHEAFADVGVMVDPYISLTEAHRISEAISARLVDHVDEIADICIHIEPDGHADAPAAYDLPLREAVVADLRAAWRDFPGADSIQRVTLHYLDEAIDVEVLMPLAEAEAQAEGAAGLQRRYAALAERMPAVRRIEVLFR